MNKLVITLAALAFAGGAAAQCCPAKPISPLVPFAAGGPTDTVARALAVSMGKTLGATIVVENAPGAVGTIAPAKLTGAARQAAIAGPAFVQKMAELGSQVVTGDKATPEGLRKHLAAEIAKWTPIIRKAGVYAD